MLMLAKDGEMVTGDEVQRPNEVVVTRSYSEADLNGRGGREERLGVPGDPLCPVGLLKRARRMRLGHFERGDNCLLTLTDGRALSRDSVVTLMRDVTFQMELLAYSVSAISLRAGGASAMWDKGCSIDETKRRGRWASDCWRVYV